ncbi:MAG TPA: signal peptidase II, partial [Candidatus Nanoarchaeia archaeon]|nr:signal peptidase II [Candidatus Nanoarchaeia archaeon]
MVKFYIVLILTVILDQFSKYIIRINQFDVVLIPNVLNITFITNTGASFGILQNMNALLLVLSIAVIIGIIVYLKKNPEQRSLPFALILAGALGNSIDRILYGAVTDFISFSFW